MNTLCARATSLLEQVYAEETAVFPFTTRLDDGRYVSDYTHPRTIRSTINALLGLQAAARHHPGHPFLRHVDRYVERFVHVRGGDVVDPGDLGLMAVLLSEGGADDLLRSLLPRLAEVASDQRRLHGLAAQDVSWLAWGFLAAARSGAEGAEPLGARVFAVLGDEFLRTNESLPRHQLRIGRGGIVSFGASVYFLHVAHAFATFFDDRRGMAAFRRGTSALLAAQGPNGEWPWLLSTRDGRPLDFYPVFSVHQHSMAMFFLFPAVNAGFEEAHGAISRSLSWVAGRNQLGRPMLQHEPFLTYRSIERKALLPRAERYLRARRVLASRRAAELAANVKVTVNQECRSYELGWMLYFLSDRPAIPEVDLHA